VIPCTAVGNLVCCYRTTNQHQKRHRHTHLQHALVIAGHKVDGHALAPETPGATDAVQVVLGLRGQVVVDHQGHLLSTKKSSSSSQIAVEKDAE
jgi:hypothetical protein